VRFGVARDVDAPARIEALIRSGRAATLAALDVSLPITEELS
jgi:hypothetical protein